MLKATRAIPIVFAIVPDPVGAGFVQRISRPGGNATGIDELLVAYGIDGTFFAKDVLVLKTADHMDHGVHFPDVRGTIGAAPRSEPAHSMARFRSCAL